jgi:hypothetical protein
MAGVFLFLKNKINNPIKKINTATAAYKGIVLKGNAINKKSAMNKSIDNTK